MISPRLFTLLELMKRLDIPLLLDFSAAAGSAEGASTVMKAWKGPSGTTASVRNSDPDGRVDVLTRMVAYCVELGLTASAASCRKLLLAEQSGAVSLDQLRDLGLELYGRMRDELDASSVFYLDAEQARLYTQPHPFGNEVADKFPQAIVDVEEAAKCLALDRGTACVFHLMRVLEVGLQSYGTKLGLGFADMKNWQKILNDVGGKMKSLPQSTRAEKEYLGRCQAIHAHLQAVKDAWRNDVMHPLASHTPEQARDVWTHTGSFMRSLASFV